jgi:poly(A) polymerase
MSRSLVSPNALKALYRLRDNGFCAYLVGGCVRDLLLGREPKDFDVATDATPSQVKRLFRNCRLVGRRFRLAHLHFADEVLEVATFRASASDQGEEEPAADGQPDEARHPQVVKSDEGMVLRDNLFGTPAEDAWRRDFTVNALFYNVADFSIIDYTGGLADLRQGVIRTIGDPWERFTEDPVRMLRAVRFAAMLGFTIEPYAWQAMTELAETIGRSAPARLYEEVLKLLLLGAGEKTYQLLARSGLLAPLFPHFATWLTEETDGYPHTWASAALAWVDEELADGRQVSPPLLLALVFGNYVGERAAAFQEAGLPPQQSLDRAVADFLGETAPTVTIPNRIGTQLRDILACQARLTKIPGRKPQALVARPFFGDALAYLRFAATQQGELAKTVAWWERFAHQQPVVEPAAGGGEERAAGGRKRRRRRPRRGKRREEGTLP